MSAAFRQLAGTSTSDRSDDPRDDHIEISDSQAPPTKPSIKRKLSITTEGDDVADSQLDCQEKENTPPYQVKSSKRGAGPKKRNDEMMAMFDSRTDLLKGFTDSFSTLVQTKKEETRQEEKIRPVDNVEHWSKILGNRVRALDARIRGRFMHHVDGLALDAEEGIWTP